MGMPLQWMCNILRYIMEVEEMRRAMEPLELIKRSGIFRDRVGVFMSPLTKHRGEPVLPLVGVVEGSLSSPLFGPSAPGLRQLARGPPPPLSGRCRGGGRVANHPFPPFSMVHMGWGRRSLLVGLPPTPSAEDGAPLWGPTAHSSGGGGSETAALILMVSIESLYSATCQVLLSSHFLKVFLIIFTEVAIYAQVAQLAERSRVFTASTNFLLDNMIFTHGYFIEIVFDFGSPILVTHPSLSRGEPVLPLVGELTVDQTEVGARAPPCWGRGGELKVLFIGPLRPWPPAAGQRATASPVRLPSRRRKGGEPPLPPLSMVHMGWGRRSLLVGLPPTPPARMGLLKGPYRLARRAAAAR
ncbi:hypothetical protein Sjap_005108 [Stephania japonica]|uniref:Uncharacterized protein n=1 Tax=Stephania japonica TaxID=461633 RepID=A0AAP0K4G4_9MAGN